MVTRTHDIWDSGKNFRGRYIINYVPNQENVEPRERFPIVMNFIYGDGDRVVKETAIILEDRIFSELYKKLEIIKDHPYHTDGNWVTRLKDEKNLRTLIHDCHLPKYVRDEITKAFNIKEYMGNFVRK